jgi:SAM-dependent methyltransferase
MTNDIKFLNLIGTVLAVLALTGLSNDCPKGRTAQLPEAVREGPTATPPSLPGQASDPDDGHQQFLDHPNWLGPFVPTPTRVVDAVLALAEVGKDDLVYDLGSGDGRIIITAAQKFGAQAVGIEWNDTLCEQASLAIRQLQLEPRARIICGDIFEQDISSATVVIAYLLPESLERLTPIMEQQLKEGARVVSIDCEIPGWRVVRQTKVIAKSRPDHWDLYLYQIR